VANEIARITVTYASYLLLEGQPSEVTEGASWEESTAAFERGVRALLLHAYPLARIDVIPSPETDAIEVAAQPTVPRKDVADVEAQARDHITVMIWEYRTRQEWIRDD
jgi:hypothetical protein